jgi:hypothetical protein
MPRRYLVITPVGSDDSAHKQWTDPARNFDLFLVNYSDTAGLYREDADRYFEMSGLKLQILAQAIKENLSEIRQYSAVWLPDDDLDISVADVMRLFHLFEDNALDLAQPAVANEFFNHVVTRRQPNSRMRLVNFVEMMCPLFRTEVLLDQLHLFTLNQSGMAIDYLWSHNTLKRKLPEDPLFHKNVAIIDEVSVIQRKKMSRSGPYYQKLSAMGVDPVREAEQLLADHNLSHVRRRYETYFTIYSHPLGASLAAFRKAKREWLRGFRFRKPDVKGSKRKRLALRGSPVIICGMHASGTTLLANILKQLGLFIGEDLEQNFESKCFIKLNMWLMDLGHTHWDYPRALLKLDQHTVISQELQNRLEERIEAYCGSQRQFSSSSGAPIPWGWKDPRNTITLPLWLQLYPDAKVIFLARNGADVALSLAGRELEISERFGKLIQGNDRPFHSVRCRSFEESFALWEEYSEIFETQSVAALSESTQLLRIQFEELLQNPAQAIARLARFVEIPAVPLERLPLRIDAGRAYAYRRSVAGREKYDTIRTSRWMERYGYMQEHKA